MVEAAIQGVADVAVQDTACWHFGDPGAPEPSIQSSIWGEASVRSLPSVNGYQAILLWNPILRGRSWDSGFFGPHLMALPATMRLEEMSSDEVELWMARLGLTCTAVKAQEKVIAGRPWWRFW